MSEIDLKSVCGSTVASDLESDVKSELAGDLPKPKGVIEFRISSSVGPNFHSENAVDIEYSKDGGWDTPSSPPATRRRHIFNFNPHYPCAHETRWPIFSVGDFPARNPDDGTLPPDNYSIVPHKFNINDLVKCIITAYTATTSLILEGDSRSRRELVHAVLEVFSDKGDISIQRIFPSMKR